MEHLIDITRKLGKGNLDLVINEVKTGLMKEQNVKDLAMKMDMVVHGVFEDKLRHRDLPDVTRLMFDAWWKVKLYKSEDGLEELKQLLAEVGFGYLAEQMVIDGLISNQILTNLTL